VSTSSRRPKIPSLSEQVDEISYRSSFVPSVLTDTISRTSSLPRQVLIVRETCPHAAENRMEKGSSCTEQLDRLTPSRAGLRRRKSVAWATELWRGTANTSTLDFPTRPSLMEHVNCPVCKFIVIGSPLDNLEYTGRSRA
jgi:hypothetical protein